MIYWRSISLHSKLKKFKLTEQITYIDLNGVTPYFLDLKIMFLHKWRNSGSLLHFAKYTGPQVPLTCKSIQVYMVESDIDSLAFVPVLHFAFKHVGLVLFQYLTVAKFTALASG